MAFIGNLILRLIVIGFGLLIAFFAAGLFYVAAVLYGMDLLGGEFDIIQSNGGLEPVDFSSVNEAELERFLAAVFVALQTFVIGASLAGRVLLASTLVIAIAELQSWRGFVTNMLLGGGIAIFAGLTGIDYQIKQAFFIILLATGFVGGFFYWLIAGRSAGRWLEEKNQSADNRRINHS